MASPTFKPSSALRHVPVSPLTAAAVVILAGVSAALHVGKLAPALPILQQTMGIKLLEAGFLLSLIQLSGMTLGWVVGLSADGIGLRRCMLGGLSILTVVSALGSFAISPVALLLCRALEGFGFLLTVTPAPSLIRRVMSTQVSGRGVDAHTQGRMIGRMMGLWGTYMPLGTALALLLGPGVIALWTWPVWWSGLALVSGLMAILVWRCVPADDAQDASDTLGWRWRLRETARTPGPWLLALCFAVYSGQWIAVVGFLPSIYALAGLPAGASALLTAAVALVNITGNAASGYLLQRGWSAQRLLTTGFAAMAGGTVLAFATRVVDLGAPPALRFIAVMVFSGVGGLIPGTLFSLSVRLSPHAATVSSTVGLMQQLSATGQFFGPPAIAWVAVAMGGWSQTWWVTGACCALGCLLAQRIERLLAQPVVEVRA